MSMTPKVSIILPVYRHEKDVGESITSSFTQSFTTVELLLDEPPGAPRDSGSSTARMSLIAIEMRGVR